MHPKGLICAQSNLEHNLREECSGGIYYFARFGKRGLSAPGKASLRAALAGVRWGFSRVLATQGGTLCLASFSRRAGILFVMENALN
jgi:hypothetical protein